MDFDALTAPGFCSLAPAEAAAEFAEGPDGTCFGDFLRFFFAIILPFYVSLVLELAMMRISTRLSRAACSGALRALAIKGLHGENLILPRPGGSAIPLAVGQHEADWRFLEAISNIKQLGLGLVTDSVHGGRPLVDGDRQAARAQKDLHQFADE